MSSPRSFELLALSLLTRRAEIALVDPGLDKLIARSVSASIRRAASDLLRIPLHPPLHPGSPLRAEGGAPHLLDAARGILHICLREPQGCVSDIRRSCSSLNVGMRDMRAISIGQPKQKATRGLGRSSRRVSHPKNKKNSVGDAQRGRQLVRLGYESELGLHELAQVLRLLRVEVPRKFHHPDRNDLHRVYQG